MSVKTEYNNRGHSTAVEGGSGIFLPDAETANVLEDLLLDRGGRRRGNEITFCCPSHEDSNPSASYNTEKGLWNCLGCGDKGRWKDLWRKAQSSNGKIIPLPGNELEPFSLDDYSQIKNLPNGFLSSLGLSDGMYFNTPCLKIDYQGINGEKLFSKYRFKAKNFRYDQGTQLNLYGLWKIEDFKKQGYVILVEGESDCHTGWHHGLPVIGVPGAKAWDDSFAEYLKDFQKIYVVIEPDQGGENFYSDLSTSPLKDKIRWIEGEFKDLSEYYLTQGEQFKDKLLELLADIDRYEDPEPDLRFVEETISKNFPELLPVTKLALAVEAGICFHDLKQPITAIILGKSGDGKTTAVNFTYPKDEALRKSYFVRADDISAKSFVSHSSSKTKEQLEKDDLLPRLDGKILFSKELSPMLNGREEDLINNFKILTPILDGKGYVNHTGAQGTRGYDRDVVFHWIGCSTPLKPLATKVMNSLGTRIVFYFHSSTEPTEENLISFINDTDHESKKDECQAVTEKFQKHFFKKNPPKSLSLKIISTSEEFARGLAKLAKFLTNYRADTFLYENTAGDTGFRTPSKEVPYRAIQIIRDLCKCYAFIHGRNQIGKEELELAKKIVLSSAPHDRMLALECLLQKEGLCSAADLTERKSVSKNTAKARLRELSLLGITEEITFNNDAGGRTKKHHFRLKDEWHSIFGIVRQDPEYKTHSPWEEEERFSLDD